VADYCLDIQSYWLLSSWILDNNDLYEDGKYNYNKRIALPTTCCDEDSVFKHSVFIEN
jgi:hypothetical protein